MADVVEVLVSGGKATAGPPIGPALGPLGINVKAVVDEINKKTSEFNGMQVPVTIEVDDKKGFTVTVGIPPTTALIKKEVHIEKGSPEPNTECGWGLADAGRGQDRPYESRRHALLRPQKCGQGSCRDLSFDGCERRRQTSKGSPCGD